MNKFTHEQMYSIIYAFLWNLSRGIFDFLKKFLDEELRVLVREDGKMIFE
jgi:hypothetical protein